MSKEQLERHDAARRFLRHTVATLASRGRKAVAGAPPEFAAFRAGETTRTPHEILAHICDLLDWAVCLAEGRHEWHDLTSPTWDLEVERFYAGLERVDARLGSDAPLVSEPERLFQGPIADALTHVGQIALLRRLATAPIRGENYFKAEIEAGRVGNDQAAPRVEFD